MWEYKICSDSSDQKMWCVNFWHPPVKLLLLRTNRNTVTDRANQWHTVPININDFHSLWWFIFLVTIKVPLSPSLSQCWKINLFHLRWIKAPGRTALSYCSVRNDADQNLHTCLGGQKTSRLCFGLHSSEGNVKLSPRAWGRRLSVT